jgi:hypothetical protein
MARFTTSAAVPWMAVLTALRSASARTLRDRQAGRQAGRQVNTGQETSKQAGKMWAVLR